MNIALKPSAKHYLQYDAATFEQEGFKTLNGRISQLALEPRFWSVSVKVITENYEGTEKIKDHFNFKTSERCKLSDLRDQVKRRSIRQRRLFASLHSMFSYCSGR